MSNLIKPIGLALALMGLSACASLSGTQTARTLKKGETESAFGGGQYSSGGLTESLQGGSTEKFSSPYLEYSYRQGLSDNLDMGVKLTFIGSALADVKYNLFANDKWAVSVGGGLGYMSLKVGDVETSIIDVLLPLYTSYDISDKWAIYFIPKMIHRSINSNNLSGTSVLTGANLGLKWGKKTGVMFEVGQFNEKDSSTPISQAHLAWFWSPKAWF
ncbi:MAG: hypothetical protein KDD50_15225 [Bdellovibrionales bacterium]|nr:hypothetical protein [Bdellovibrionales bacterium]